MVDSMHKNSQATIQNDSIFTLYSAYVSLNLYLVLWKVNQTVDSMQEERTKLQSEITHLKSELETQTKTRRTLEQENATLLDRVSQFDHQRVCN